MTAPLEPMAEDEANEAEQPSGAVPGPTPMSDEDVQSRLDALMTDARSYDETDLAPFRAQATDYYFGRPFGNEEDGRSKVVLTELRDVVGALLPSLMRVLIGPERAVEYRPRSATAVELVEQQNDYINLIFLQDNQGFRLLHSVLKDALVRRRGVLKWWWEETPRSESTRHTGLTQAQIGVLGADPSVTVSNITVRPGIAPDGSPATTYDCDVVHVIRDGRVRIACLPPEEFVYNRAARSREHAVLMAHISELSVSDLRAMGVSEDEIAEARHSQRSKATNVDQQARTGGVTTIADVAEQDENEPLLYTEAYVDMDVDGDGVAELRKICALGTAYDVIRNEPAPERPFAIFVPDPEPHTIEGLCTADQTMDLQLIKSAIARGVLDSLNLTLNPQREVVEGQVNMQDVLNREIGAIIRSRAPGMIREVDHRFVGADALPVLGYFDDIKEDRTGQNRGAQGLEPQTLQSTTQAAVAATVSASQQRLELLARIFAETGLRDLFEGLYKLVVRHQNVPRMLRMRNQWVEVDPRYWNADVDVIVNVALGGGLPEERLQTLLQIAEKQEQVLDKYGPSNPLVTVAQYRRTLASILKLRGFPDASLYFNEVPDDWQPPAPPPQPTDPAQVLAEGQLQIEAAKAQAEAHRKDLELQLKQEEMLRKDDLERDKLATETELRMKEIEAKYHVDLDETRIKADIERARIESQAEVQIATAGTVAAASKPAAPRRQKITHVRGPDGKVAASIVESDPPPVDPNVGAPK